MKCELHIPVYEHICYENIDGAIKNMFWYLQIQLFDIIFTVINGLRRFNPLIQLKNKTELSCLSRKKLISKAIFIEQLESLGPLTHKF